MLEKLYTIEEAEAVTSVENYLAHFVDIKKFLAFCQECPNYGVNWSCPPFNFQVEKLWKKYKNIHLFARFLIPKNQDGEVLLESLWIEKEKFALELLEKEKLIPGSLALSCGSCKLCEVCNRVKEKICQDPDYMRYSIEALGGDVGETSQKFFGKPLLWVKDGIAPEYLVLVGGLLVPEDM